MTSTEKNEPDRVEARDPDECDEHEAASILGGISVSTLQRYACRGQIPSYKIGWRRCYSRSALEAHKKKLIDEEMNKANRTRAKVLGIGVVK